MSLYATVQNKLNITLDSKFIILCVTVQHRSSVSVNIYILLLVLCFLTTLMWLYCLYLFNWKYISNVLDYAVIILINYEDTSSSTIRYLLYQV